MFWGLIMEPSRCYSQTVKVAFRISMASLDVNTLKDDFVQVLCVYGGRNYLLCTLSKTPGTWQHSLDLAFEAGTKISFATIGNGVVHLTGYLTAMGDDSEDEDFKDIEEEEEDDKEVLKFPVHAEQKMSGLNLAEVCNKNISLQQLDESVTPKDNSLPKKGQWGSGMYCAVANCGFSYTRAKRENVKLSFHRFPPKESVRKLWIRSCGRSDTFNANTSFICSRHFCDDDFERDLRAELLGLTPKRHLKTDIIPRLNLPDDSVKTEIVSQQSRRRTRQKRQSNQKLKGA